jgi:hypothetical protein
MTAEPRARRGSEETLEACVIGGCPAEPVRSISRFEARKAFPALPEEGRRAPLCREHYKQYKKATRKSRELDRLGW